MRHIPQIHGLSPQDGAIAHILFAKDCLCNGQIPTALNAIDYALRNLTKHDAYAVDCAVVRLLEG